MKSVHNIGFVRVNKLPDQLSNPVFFASMLMPNLFFGPPPPDIPSFRVSYEFAFTNVGIDYAGPLFVKEIYLANPKMFKAYLLLCTCAATRNVQIGKFNMAISDNFQTFITDELKQFLAFEEIKWTHILPKSPWWGASYERLIRIIKESLRKCVSKAKLMYEELETVLVEIEMVINSRPLTYLYEEAEEASTPSHLVIGRRLLNTSMKGDGYVAKHSADLLHNHYKYLQNVIQHYSKRFSKEYLSELDQRRLYTRGKGNYDEFCKLLLGDVVLIGDEFTSLIFKSILLVDIYSFHDELICYLNEVSATIYGLKIYIYCMLLLPFTTCRLCSFIQLLVFDGVWGTLS